jgi:hypothetical protein
MFPMVNEYEGNNNEWKGDVMILDCRVVWWSFQKMASLEGGRFIHECKTCNSHVWYFF